MIARIAFAFAAGILCAALAAGNAAAQARDKKTITLAAANKMAAAAEAEAEKNHIHISIAIVDDDGNLIFLERMDGALRGPMEVAKQKARTSASFNQPTKFFEDRISQGGSGSAFLSIPQIVAMGGAYPIDIDGQEAGAIAVGGAMDALDEQCVKAALASLAK